MPSFTFDTTVASPHHHKSHHVLCTGRWDGGDCLSPPFFNPERVWVLRGRQQRQLREVPFWLWEALSYQGEDAWRDECWNG